MRPAAHPLDPLIAAESEGKALEEIVAAADASHVDPHLVDAGACKWVVVAVLLVVVVAFEEIVAAADSSHVDPGLVDAGARQWEEAGECFFDLDSLLGRGLLLESSYLVDIGPFPSDCSTFD